MSTADEQRGRRVVVYLTQNLPLRRAYLRESIASLFSSFNATFRYPIWIFHQGDFGPDAQEQVKDDVANDLGFLIEFKLIASEEFEHPKDVTAGVVANNRKIVEDARDLSYRSMCRWWLQHFPLHVREFEYYMRLDDDSILHEPLANDPFQTAAAGGLDYVSNLVHLEHPLNALGAVEAAERFFPSASVDRLAINCRAEDVVPHAQFRTFLSELPDGLVPGSYWRTLRSVMIYYNNFHIARPSVWASSPIREFFTDPRVTAGIYHLRWGDALLQTLAIAGAGLAAGRLPFRYTKRYERSFGPYENTNHEVALQFFGRADPETGSMIDFAAFRSLLHERSIDLFDEIR